MSTGVELCWKTSSSISCVPMDQIYWRMQPTSSHWSHPKSCKLQALISVRDTTSLFLLHHLFELSFGRARILPLALKQNKETRLLIYACHFAVYNYMLWRFFPTPSLRHGSSFPLSLCYHKYSMENSDSKYHWKKELLVPWNKELKTCVKEPLPLRNLSPVFSSCFQTDPFQPQPHISSTLLVPGCRKIKSFGALTLYSRAKLQSTM